MRGGKSVAARFGCKARSAVSTCVAAWTSCHGRLHKDRVRGWEASGEVGVIKSAVPSVSEAIDRFFEDAEARGLAEATIGKLNVLLRKQLLPWCRSKGYLSLK